MDEASPRFRQDLESANTEADGVPCVDVTDPRTGTNFRFYDFEYQLALQLNGQPVGDVIAWASAAYGVDLTTDGIKEFAGRLSELGFLEAGADQEGGKAADELDDAEQEWVQAEGAKTAQFVPDPAMLDSPSELTPVAPALPTMEAMGEGAAGSPEPKPPEAPTAPMKLFDIPMPAAAAPPPTSAKAPAPTNDVPTAPSLPAIKSAFAPSTAKPAASWAIELDGTLQPEGEKGTPPPAAPAQKDAVADTKTPPPLVTTPAAAPSLPARATPAPAGTPERRQPPAPDAVQMAPFSADAAAAAAKATPKSNTGRTVGIIVALLVMAGIGYVVWTRMHSRLPQAVRVRVLSPKPATVYRWFSGRGTVTDHEARTLSFESPGMLAELLPPGTSFVAGDILGRLRAAQPVEAMLNRHRARLAFYQQMRESMRTANNQPELRQAEIKLADKQRLVDESAASLAKLVLRATEPGEVVETLAKVGTPVAAHAPLLRVKGRMLHGEFEIDPVESTGKLEFCRVEVVGLGPRASNAEAHASTATAADVGSPEAQAAPRFVDCTASGAADGTQHKIRVALSDNLGLVPGQPLRLARQRFDAVFPIPAAAVAGTADHRSVWVATAGGTAERRDVVVADLGDEALVTEGLRVGEDVIVDPPAGLQPGAAIIIDR